jgi:ubiquinone/menaquinone biosynthesis C-methylase UbiE
MVARKKKGYRGLPLEGVQARWYAKTTARDMARYREAAAAVAHQAASGSSVLEVAPGPGFLAIELARLGNYRIVGLDISKTFVQMAADNATKAGVAVTFRRGDAASMPFEPDSFDLIVCRAAFKNFREPVRALREMHRVLRPGGKALIMDLRRDAPAEQLDAYVNSMGLSWINTLITKWIFRYGLVKSAYSPEQLRQMTADTPFQTCEVQAAGIGMEVSFRK